MLLLVSLSLGDIDTSLKVDSDPRIDSGRGALLLSVEIVEGMLHSESAVNSRCGIGYKRNFDLGLGRYQRAT